VPSDDAAFEIKYAMPASRAAAVAAWLDARCERDPHYPEGHVRSLYLDTPGLRYLTEKVEGDYLKTKLRLRWYAVSQFAPAAGSVWLEVKQRENVRRSKTRVRFAPQAADLDRADPGRVDAAPAIQMLRDQGFDAPESLRPTLALGYARSRWVEPITGAGVALDQAIQPMWFLGRSRPPTEALELRTAVVEFKGRTADLPAPLRGILRFGCRRTSFSKYYRCYARLVAGADADTGPDTGGDVDAGILD
jgi:hypothetical protein